MKRDEFLTRVRQAIIFKNRPERPIADSEWRKSALLRGRNQHCHHRTTGSARWPCGPPKAMQTRKCADAMESMGLRRVFKGVPYGPRRATKSDEDASGRPNRINGLRRVFKGVPYGPRRATKSDEDASGRPNRISGLRRVFKGVPYGPRGPPKAMQTRNGRR